MPAFGKRTARLARVSTRDSQNKTAPPPFGIACQWHASPPHPREIGMEGEVFPNKNRSLSRLHASVKKTEFIKNFMIHDARTAARWTFFRPAFTRPSQGESRHPATARSSAGYHAEKERGNEDSGRSGAAGLATPVPRCEPCGGASDWRAHLFATRARPDDSDMMR